MGRARPARARQRARSRLGRPPRYRSARHTLRPPARPPRAASTRREATLATGTRGKLAVASRPPFKQQNSTRLRRDHPSATVAPLQRGHDYRRAQAWQRAGARRARAPPLQDLRALAGLGVQISSGRITSIRRPTTATSTGPSDQPPTQATRLSTWDAQHYLFLATEGYHPASARSRSFRCSRG